MLRALDALGACDRLRSTMSVPISTPTRSQRKGRGMPSPYFSPNPSPYFTPARSDVKPTTRAVKPTKGSRRSIRLSKPTENAVLPPSPPPSTKQRAKRKARVKSSAQMLQDDSVDAANAKKKGKGTKKHLEVVIPVVPTTKSRSEQVKTMVIASETGETEQVGKIFLIQERLRHDPWKMLVATTLLNVTSGRAARPVFIELLKKWPNAKALADADTEELVKMLHCLGLSLQRAASLKMLSQQYLSLGWPLVDCHHPHNPYDDPLPPLPLPVPSTLPDALDVKIFRGAGRYASDSFRIYSHLLPGRGGPDRESRWLDKRTRALKRRQDATRESHSNAKDDPIGPLGDEDVAERVLAVEEIGEYLSDEEDAGEEEWRRVRPTDKELRRYLIWRWGLEGIVYDINRGPKIIRERDISRLHLDED